MPCWAAQQQPHSAADTPVTLSSTHPTHGFASAGSWLVVWQLHFILYSCRSSVEMWALVHVGYGLLGPFARHKGWAPGPIGDWKNGATGWVLWISLAIMLGDSLTSLSLLLATSLHRHITALRSASHLLTGLLLLSDMSNTSHQ